MDTLTDPPPVIERPRFALWLWERDISTTEAGAHIGVGREAVRRWCLPFSDPARVEPRRTEKAKIFEWTDGLIGPADWYPAALSQLRADRVPEDVQ